MANEVRFDIVATDKASKQLDDVATKAEHVEKLDPTVDIGADTRDADHSIDGLDEQLAKLTKQDQVVVLALRAGAAQNELTDLATKLATIDKSDPSLDVTFDRYKEVSGQLDDLKSKIVDIGDTPIDPGGGDGGKNLDNAKNKLHDVGEEADRTKDSVHSMAGNAVGDFAQTASGIGPLGEALGQLTELASSGEASLRQLGSAALGLGAISAGIAVLNVVMQHFADAAKKAAEIKAFDEKQVKDYTSAVQAATKALDDLNGVKVTDPVDKTASERVQDLQSKTQALIDLWTKAGTISAFDPVTGQIEDMTSKLAEAGITAQEWAAAIINGGVSINQLGTDARNAGVSADTTRQILQTAAAEAAKYETGQRNAADAAKVFGTNTDTATDSQKAMNAESARYQGLADQYQRETQQTIDKLSGLTSATHEYASEYAGLSDEINHDQSMINLRQQIDDVKQAGIDAMTAQHDADEARRQGAKDAGEKQDEATQKMRAFQTATNDLKTDIINLGQTAGENPVNVKADVDKIDQGDLDAVAADAEAYYRRNPIDAATRLKLISTIVSGVGQPVTLNQPSVGSAPTVTNVNNFLARPAAAREIARTQSRHARINGR